MGQIAAAAGDDPDLPAELAGGEAGGDPVVEGRAPGRENDRPLAGEETFAADGLGRGADGIEEGIDRRGLLQHAFEALDPGEGQPLAPGRARNLQRLVQAAAARAGAGNAHLEQELEARRMPAAPARRGDPLDSGEAVDQAIDLELGPAPPARRR